MKFLLNGCSPAKQRGRVGPLAIESLLLSRIALESLSLLSFSRPVHRQLRKNAMRYPTTLADPLIGALELYDENGDEEALVENLKAIP